MSFAEVPIPIRNYIFLLQQERSPYSDAVRYLVRLMEEEYKSRNGEVIYFINPRELKRKIEETINKTISLSNLCRCIYALLYGTKLKEGEDFYVTTSAGGRRNYHVKVNEKTLKAFKIFASI